MKMSHHYVEKIPDKMTLAQGYIRPCISDLKIFVIAVYPNNILTG